MAAIVLSLNDVTCGKLDEIDATGYGIPVFIATENQERVPAEYFRALVDYVNQGNSAFDCPGHQGGEFFRRHPAGNQFVEYFGEALFRADLCNTGLSGNGT